MATTTKNISLDFYNNSIINVYAKQSDANSRFVNVTCTDHGKKVFIDGSYITAFIRMKKSDGTFVYNDAEILNDGTVLITLTQQMLAVDGKQDIDVMLIATPDITSDEMNTLDAANDLSNVSVISVMQFYLIVHTSVVDDSSISSSNEFNALITASANMIQLESSVKNAEGERVSAEIKRQDDVTGEEYRIANEQSRIEAEIKRQDGVSGEEYRIANEKVRQQNEIKRQDDITGEEYRIANEKARIQAEANRNETLTLKVSECNDATNAANAVVEEFETIKDFSGIIMQSEKGEANGVATLDSNKKIPSEQLDISSFIKNNLTTTSTGYILDASQGNILNSLITLLSTKIDNLPQIYSGVDDPDSSLGKDGDIYLKIIED